MEEALDWLQLVPMEYRRLLWFRAEGWSWRKLGRYFGCGSRQVRLRWRDGVFSLWEIIPFDARIFGPVPDNAIRRKL